jgi:PHD/YefM family antitoxin component YafN of YafNO toxin-antitoxin module
MIALNEKYVVAADGKPTAVVLDMRTYRRLLRHIEEMEDALALDEAARTAEGFRPYAEVRAELKKKGRL